MLDDHSFEEFVWSQMNILEFFEKSELSEKQKNDLLRVWNVLSSLYTRSFLCHAIEEWEDFLMEREQEEAEFLQLIPQDGEDDPMPPKNDPRQISLFA